MPEGSREVVGRVDRPYWFSWLNWHLHQRFRRHKAAQRRAGWQFVNHIRAMPPGSLVIDGGANVGNVTSLFARHGFEVHAFEPDPAASAVFERRFGDNPMIHLHCAALGTEATTMRLYRTKQFATRGVKATTSSTLFPRESHSDADSAEVEVVDLAAFIAGLGRRVDLLKLDVEGAEIPILERVIDLGLHREIGLVFAETHERHSPDLAERTARLRRRLEREAIANINLDWR
jgi:FkbM family methyltransferase